MGMTAVVALIANETVAPAQWWPGGNAALTLQGTVGGATVKLQRLGPDGVNYMDVTGSSQTAVGYVSFALPPCLVKAVVTGGTPAGLYASLERITEAS